MIRLNLKLLFFFKILLIFLFIFFKSYADNTALNKDLIAVGSNKSEVKIKIFSSLTCPHCANFHLNIVPKIKKIM